MCSCARAYLRVCVCCVFVWACVRVFQATGNEYPPSEPLPSELIDSIRMGTTVATNALLERQGEPCALAITSGYKDLLHIGNQARPSIFDLVSPDHLAANLHATSVDEILSARISLAANYFLAFSKNFFNSSNFSVF